MKMSLPTSQRHTLASVEEMDALASSVATSLTPTTEGATVLGLSGELGSGKTTFVKAFARALGVEEHVTSPTFVLEKIYKLERADFDHLIHIDAYRLESGSELLTLGWGEMMANPKNLIVIEWPERVAEVLPSTMKTLRFVFIDDSTREISL